MMIERLLTKEGWETLHSILNTRAAITRQEQRKRMLRVLSLLVSEQVGKQVGRDLVIEAAEMVLGKTCLPLLQMRNPDQYKRLVLERYYDVEAYYAGPYEVRRWDSIRSKPTKHPEKMKLVAFSASPRKRGNTEALVDEAIRGAEDAGAKGEKIRLQELNLKFCIGCKKCKEPGFEAICAQQDDMSVIYQKIIDSDAIIIGFPIYRWRECGQLATFFDRLFCFSRYQPGIKSSDALIKKRGGEASAHVMVWYSALLELGRRALVIGTWGTPHADTYDEVMDRVINLLSQVNIETVEAISACGFAGMLHGLDEKGRAIIHRFPKEMEKAYQAGRSLVTGEG